MRFFLCYRLPNDQSSKEFWESWLMADGSDKFSREVTRAFQELLGEYVIDLHGYSTSDISPCVPSNPHETVEIDHEKERCSIEEFLRKPCPCGRNCQSQFEPEEVFEARADFRSLTKGEQNCFILAQLRSAVRSTGVVHSGRTTTARERQKFDYRINADRPVCRDVFLFFHGETQKRLKRLQQHLAQHGTSPPVHGNQGRVPVNAFSHEGREAVKTFVLNYAAAHGLPDPGRDVRKGKGRLRILLPTVMSYQAVYGVYQQSLDAQKNNMVGYRTFVRIWQEEAPHIVFNNPRTDLCMLCEDFKKKINQVAAQLDERQDARKAEVYKEALAHLVDAKQERTYYQAVAKVAQNHYEKLDLKSDDQRVKQNSLNMLLHYSWDFAQQLSYPYEEQQVGPIYFKTPRHAQLFGVCCEGIPRQVNYLIDEADFIEKDANTVISLLHHFFANHGLGEQQVHLSADNCVGQNKNNAVLQYLLYRVLAGLHTRIDLSFLLVGHTKFSPDGYFGLIRRRYRRSQVYTYKQLVEVIKASSKNGHNICQQYRNSGDQDRDVTYYDWTSWLGQYFSRLPKLTHFHHFRFDKETPGSIIVKIRCNAPEESLTLLKKKFRKDWSGLLNTNPRVLTPPELTAKRAWYLYDKIRCHIPREEDKDETCPLPKVGRPNSW